MGGGPNPKGQSLGLVNCTLKADIPGNKTILTFNAPGVHLIATVDDEVGEYFSEGQSYDLDLLTP